MKLNILASIIILLLLSSCTQAAQSGNPAWVDHMIQQFESDPVTNPPLSVWKYEYIGQTVYFVPAHCCDIFSVVYDENGTMLCAPDGGLTGKGDGKCTDFFDKRTGEQLIWQDNRTR
jgi:YHS domain-containing protein